ncbi:MAG: hypothetical protein LC633_08265 [Desulfobulbaceae bacterium]|nr:hypothetical protein [Desulfobulbaceae bacterium]
MKRIIAAVWLLASTAWGFSPIYAEPPGIPVATYGGQGGLEVSEKTLDAYHNEMSLFYSESAYLRHNIREKIHLFANLLTDPDTDKDEIMALQREIQVQTNELQARELSFRWDLHNRFPELATNKYRSCLGAATGTRGAGR